MASGFLSLAWALTACSGIPVASLASGAGSGPDPTTAGPATATGSASSPAEPAPQVADPRATPDCQGASAPPVLFNTTVSASPGDVVSLQGENFGDAPVVHLDGAPTPPLEIVNRVGTGWLAVRIPPSAAGALALRIDSGCGVSAPVELDAARPYHLDATRLSPGGAFRLFGRNLLLAGSTPSLTIDGLPATIDLARSDEHVRRHVGRRRTPPARCGRPSSTGIGHAARYGATSRRP